MKIAFLISSLSKGGAEGVAAGLCNSWQSAGHTVDILTFQTIGEAIGYDLSEGINLHPLALMKESHSVIKFLQNNVIKIFYLRRRLKAIAPDVLVAFVTDINIIAILASCGLGIPVIISERVHPGAHKVKSIHNLLRKYIYPRAHTLVVQTQDIAVWVKTNLNMQAEVVANPVREPKFRRQAHVDSRNKIIAVGRFTRQKGFDLLIEAFSNISNNFPDWELTIFGNGPERASLERQVRLANLSESVHLPGQSLEIAKEISMADIYVHPARYEGFPNSLLEALAGGLCCIGTDGPGGVAEILKNGEFGFVIESENIDELAKTLAIAMTNETIREHYAHKAPLAINGFTPEIIARKWISILENAQNSFDVKN